MTGRFVINFVILLILVNSVNISFAIDMSKGASICDFGAIPDDGKDDSKAIQKALQSGSKLIIFPPGLYNISNMIETSISKCEIIGHGYPVLKAKNSEIDIFKITAHQVAIKGIHFEGGKRQLFIGNDNIDLGFIQIIDCHFIYSKDFAIEFFDKTYSTFAMLDKCFFRQCMQVLKSYSDLTVFQNSWVTTSEKMKNKAVIENYGTRLVCNSILGVPLVNGYNQRWIDNYNGVLVCNTFRFGGEGGGFTPVFNCVKANATGSKAVILNNCVISGIGNSQHPCAVYLKEIPNQVLIRDSILIGIKGVMVNKELNLSNYFSHIKDSAQLIYEITGNTGLFVGEFPKEILDAASKVEDSGYGDIQLTLKDLKAAMERAINDAKKLSSESPGVMLYEDNFSEYTLGRKQQTQKSKYINITPETACWDIEDYMDATLQKNSEFLSFAKSNDDIVILHRIDRSQAQQYWPHILISEIYVDLEKTPYLSWRFKDNGSNVAAYAVKLIDPVEDKTIKLTEMHWPPYFDYRTYDLREILGKSSGKYTFNLKLYILGMGLDIENKPDFFNAQMGDWVVLDFLRLESK